jgi:hypothetical protein
MWISEWADAWMSGWTDWRMDALAVGLTLIKYRTNTSHVSFVPTAYFPHPKVLIQCFSNLVKLLGIV